MKDYQEIQKKYKELLILFLGDKEEQAFYEVTEIGKELVLSRRGPDILLQIHADSLKSILQDVDPLTISRKVVSANDVLLNAIMAYAMNFYNFLDLIGEEKIRLENARLELEQSNIKLKEVDRLKSVFIASMNHELRSPLNAIIGFSTILINEMAGPINAEQKENLILVKKAGKLLLTLINDVIDVSKIESGSLDILIEDFELKALLEEVEGLYREDALLKGLTFKTEFQGILMHTDKQRLFQCVCNLVSNAIKYTLKGGIQVKTCFVSGTDQIGIQVLDSGIGIRTSDLPTLGSPFVRLESPLRAQVPGTGLGIFLVKRLLNKVLQGMIKIESTYNKGTCVEIVIPTKI